MLYYVWQKWTAETIPSSLLGLQVFPTFARERPGPDHSSCLIKWILGCSELAAEGLGDRELREWLVAHRGRGMTARQLRFWGVLYDLPTRQVNQWVKTAKTGVWGRR